MLFFRKIETFFCVTEKGINKPTNNKLSTKTNPKLSNYIPTMMIARSINMAKVAAKKVSFKNDHPNLMKPRATDMFIFEKNGVIADFVHQKMEPVKERTRRLCFGIGRSLAEMAGETSQNNFRTISVTTERVDPEEVLKNKAPASPAHTPTTAFCNNSKAWEKIELNALKKACTSYHDLFWKREEITKLNDPALTKQVDEINSKLVKVKKEMKKIQQNLRNIRDFR